MDNNILTIALSGIFALISTVTVNIVASIISKRQRTASAQKDEGDAAKTLSEATKIQLETYNTQILAPMKLEIDSLRSANAMLEEKLSRAESDLAATQSLVSEVREGLSKLIIELERSDSALEFICNAVKATFSSDVEKAYKIRSGEIPQSKHATQQEITND